MEQVEVSGQPAAHVRQPIAVTAPAQVKSRKAPKVMAILVIFFAIAGAAAFVLGRGHESTDDAQVEGHITNVASRVGGRVEKVLVEDNQVVDPGQTLVELEKDELEARLAAAKADQAAAQAGLKAAQAQYAIAAASADSRTKPTDGSKPGVSVSRATLEQSQADVASARSRFKLAQLELSRANSLRKESVISTAEFDARQSQFDQARANLDQAEARMTGAKIGHDVTAPAQVDAAQAAVDLAMARLAQTDAALKLSEVNLAYASIKAPVRGMVSRRSVEGGQVVGPGTPLLAIVPQDDVWIVANFKEDQIAEMRPGQPAEIRIDSFGRHPFHGTVESLASSTGAKFALLPPDNASGNFVKVVQRVPVRIKVEAAAGLVLRPGMSADVTVQTVAK